MPTTQIADLVVPEEFTRYQVENSFVSSAFLQSGVAVQNGVIQDQLAAGATQFTVPVWNDLADIEPNYSTDNPNQLSTPNKINAYSMNVRKTFGNQSWSTMDLAGELSGDSPLQRIKDRVAAYWTRHMERRLIASLLGVLYSDVANNSGDMVVDISGAGGGDTAFNGNAVINAAATLGDRLNDVKAIAMNSRTYKQALINDEVTVLPSSQGQPIRTYKGLAVILDDSLQTAAGLDITVLFAPGAVGYGTSEPREGVGTEVWRNPAAGNGGGQSILYSRMNIAMQPAGFTWSDTYTSGGNTVAITGESPSLDDLATPGHWTRATSQRKAIPLAFLITKAVG